MYQLYEGSVRVQCQADMKTTPVWPAQARDEYEAADRAARENEVGLRSLYIFLLTATWDAHLCAQYLTECCTHADLLCAALLRARTQHASTIWLPHRKAVQIHRYAYDDAVMASYFLTKVDRSASGFGRDLVSNAVREAMACNARVCRGLAAIAPAAEGADMEDDDDGLAEQPHPLGRRRGPKRR